jgi:hypothetical protein
MAAFKRVMVLVEGQTEEQFITQVIAPHLWPREFSVEATRVLTSMEEGRRAHRGGVTKYERIRNDVKKLLRSKYDAVTMLFDVYGFPKDLPGYPSPWPVATAERASLLAAAIDADIQDRRFFAYLAAHEFEGFLFSDTTKLANALGADAPTREEFAAALEVIRAGYPTPEDINDGKTTAPSKRILGLVPTYNKPRQGVAAAKDIGLDAIRAACPLFNAWVTKLENL